MATVSTVATFLATGNNLTFSGDITSRVLTCDLDPEMEHPEERQFKADLYRVVPDLRRELVASALTILRAFDHVGRPNQGLSRWAGFDEWSDWVRFALVWVGMADPCETRARIEEQDPVRRTLTTLLNAWISVLGSDAVTGSEVVKVATGECLESGGARPALRDALLEVAGKRGEINTRVLGNYLQAHAMRIEGGLRLERAGTRSGVALWRVVTPISRG
jgi:hypothetical protein